MIPDKKEKMLVAFDAFAARIADKYKEARDALDKEDYIRAEEILNTLTRSHAKTTLSLHKVLIRDGVIKEDD